MVYEDLEANVDVPEGSRHLLMGWIHLLHLQQQPPHPSCLAADSCGRRSSRVTMMPPGAAAAPCVEHQGYARTIAYQDSDMLGCYGYQQPKLRQTLM